MIDSLSRYQYTVNNSTVLIQRLWSLMQHRAAQLTPTCLTLCSC